MKVPPALAVSLCLTIPAFAQSERLVGLQMGTGSALTIVFLHGDQTSGGDPNYLTSLASEIAKRLPEATLHLLLRPGYADPWGRQSPGENFDRRDQYTMESAELINDTLAQLKGDAPLMVVGHSGGAAQTALAMSLNADLIDEAILVGCPCDLALWKAANPRWPDDMFIRSVSAVDVTPVTRAKVTILVGENDSVTPPEQSRSYLAHLLDHGIDASMVRIPGGDHVGNRELTRVWLQTVLDATRRLTLSAR